jgi:hypothetical protein
MGASLIAVLHQHPAGGNHFFSLSLRFCSLFVPSDTPLFRRFICTLLHWRLEAVNYFRHFFSLYSWPFGRRAA